MRKILLGALCIVVAACSPAAGQTSDTTPRNAQPVAATATAPVVPIASQKPTPARPTATPPPNLPTQTHSSPTSTANPAPAAGQLVFVAGSTEKVCQLTGDVDWETGKPTAALTFTNFGLDAVDLGYPVEHQGRLLLLFGDTWPPHHPKIETAQQSEVPPDDSVGFTLRTTPPDAADGKCLELQFNHDALNKYVSPTITGPIPVKQGFFNVPSGGVSLGSLLYAFFFTDHCADPNLLSRSAQNPLTRPVANPTTKCSETDRSNSVGRGVMAQSADNGKTFSHVVSLPTGFVYATAVNTDGQTGLPPDQRLGVFIFAVPRYRASIPYLAYAPTQSFVDPATWHFFTGISAEGQPTWADSAAWVQNPVPPAAWNPPGAPELFAAKSEADRCVGEFSVNWSSGLGQWLMTYGCEAGMTVRMASAPWGPWSAPVVMLKVGTDIDCKLLMIPDGCGNRRDFWPGKQTNGKLERGGLYAPFLLNRYNTVEPGANGGIRATMYWLVSTWNPYEVDVMRSTLEVNSGTPRP
jgi:hypothetical protein